MSTGTIERLVRDHGFGFIKAGEGIALFFHRSEVQDVSFDLLKEGQSVEFKVSLSPKGLKATNVKLANKKPRDVWTSKLVANSIRKEGEREGAKAGNLAGEAG